MKERNPTKYKDQIAFKDYKSNDEQLQGFIESIAFLAFINWYWHSYEMHDNRLCMIVIL